MSHITAIGTANPAYRFSQAQIADFMVRGMQLDQRQTRLLRAIFKASGIEYRYSVLGDYGLLKDYTFYSNTADLQPFPSTSKRLDIFRKEAVELSIAAVTSLQHKVPEFDPAAITHLITVSCTGMYAPGLDIDLVKRLRLPTTIQRTGINFMGCYAAFNALKAADALCLTDRNAKVLIVCVELCSLHFQQEPTEDNLIANALFSDGAAAVLVEAETKARIRLTPESFCSDISVDGENDMAWGIGDQGFEMKLSTYVPTIIKNGITKLTSKLLSKISKELRDVRYFAIHPGGTKILEGIELELGIQKEYNEPAYHILRNYGNMSSPTVLFVLDEIMRRLTPNDQGEYILSFAFGPGLTLESMVVKIEIG